MRVRLRREREKENFLDKYLECTHEVSSVVTVTAGMERPRLERMYEKRSGGFGQQTRQQRREVNPAHCWDFCLAMQQSMC